MSKQQRNGIKGSFKPRAVKIGEVGHLHVYESGVGWVVGMGEGWLVGGGW